MTAQPREIEGTWEEIQEHSAELSRRRVRVTVIPETTPPETGKKPPSFRPSSGNSLLRHAGTWEGDDLEECLRLVYETRSQLEF